MLSIQNLNFLVFEPAGVKRNGMEHLNVVSFRANIETSSQFDISMICDGGTAKWTQIVSTGTRTILVRVPLPPLFQVSIKRLRQT